MAGFFTIKRSSFTRNVASLVGGTVMGRAIIILAAPIIARLFTPEDFGVAALIISVAVVLNSISSFRYENAIMLPEEWPQAAALIRLSFIILCVFCLLLFLLFGCVHYFNLQIPLLENLGGLLLLIPLAVFLLGIGNIIRQWAVREKRFKVIGYAEIGGSAAVVGSRVVLGITLGSSIYGLMIGYLLGVFVTTWMLTRKSLGTVKAVAGVARVGLGSVAYRYRDFLFYSSPTGLLRTLSENLPILIMGALYSPAVVGFYAIAARLVKMPVKIIGESVQSVYMQKAAEIRNEGYGLGKSLVKMTVLLSVVGFPIFATLFFFGEYLFGILLGERWATAGRYVEVLSPLLFVMFVLSPANGVFTVLEKQRVFLLLQVIKTIAAVAAFSMAAALVLDALQALILYTVFGVVANIVSLIIAFYLANDGRELTTGKQL